MYRSLLGGLVRALRDVLGYLGASLWRFLVLWVRLLVGYFVGVFLHCYFYMYLLRGISTLYAPALPRALMCVPARLCTYLRVPARSCAFLYALLVRCCIVPVRCGEATSRLVRFGSSWVSCAPQVLASFVYLGFASFVYLARFAVFLVLASFVPILHALGIVFCMALFAFLLRKALALSFMHTSAFCIIFILSNAYVPKTFLYKSCI